MNNKIAALLLGSAVTLAAGNLAVAQDKTVKIGSLSDQSGLYADLGGPGSTLAAQMAVEDSGMTAKGWKIDIISGDHLNKPDVGVNIARQWFDVDKVDVIVDIPNSGVALAVSNKVKEKNGILLNSGAGSSDLTNAQCTPNTIHWAYDTYTLAHGTGTALAKAAGGKILGGVKHPLGTSDFSSFLLQAQASKAKIIGLANAGADTTNSIKQAAEFGIVAGGQKLAALLLFITDVHSLGLNTAQGLNFTETFYWDMNDQTRVFAKRFQERMKNHNMPTMVHAGVYASLLHYFKALEALGGNPHDGAKVVAKMKELPTDDPLFGKGSIEPNGRTIHPAYLFEVKKPSESKGPWDYYQLMATIPADEAFTPLDKSTCPLLKK